MTDTPPLVHRLGIVPYLETWERMKAFTDQRQADTADELWLLEHSPVFTQGQAGKAEHLLDPGSIPVVQADRGGQVTYHGPGQLVLYTLLDLRRRNLGVRALVDLIEQGLVSLLSQYGITGSPLRDAPGVYVDGMKIAQLGLRIRRGCSYHGLSLNVDMDLTPFSRINPCGHAKLPVTSMVNLLGEPVDKDAVGEALIVEFLRGLHELA